MSTDINLKVYMWETNKELFKIISITNITKYNIKYSNICSKTHQI